MSKFLFVKLKAENAGNNFSRPDIEQAYPDYLFNYRAGWGYMMLTYFLPNSGNGTFYIHAITTDAEGHQVTLGTKTITCDNANAIKPFGAIDTPTQGGTASGSNFINWGWVLTPQPINYFEPVIIKKGCNENKRPQEIYPDDEGVIGIEIKELERVEIKLEGTMGLAPLSTYTGFLVIDGRLRSLPIGSALDIQRGIFYWQPGVGFYGTYEFVFLKADGSDRRRIRVRIQILPK